MPRFRTTLDYNTRSGGITSDSAAAPTAARAAAPNDCREPADAELADANVRAAANATAEANATAVTRVNWCQLAGSLIPLSPSEPLPLMSYEAMLPTAGGADKGRAPHLGRSPQLNAKPIDGRHSLCLWSR